MGWVGLGLGLGLGLEFSYGLTALWGERSREKGKRLQHNRQMQLAVTYIHLYIWYIFYIYRRVHAVPKRCKDQVSLRDYHYEES